jgi:uncharacterized SAM-binding protein YcdF (DUF218 family)
MFFFLSKTISYLAMPYTIVFVIFTTGLLVKNPKWKKRCLWSAFGLLLFFSNDFIVNEVMKAWELDAKAFADVRHYKVAIVLTGATQGYREPDDRVYFTRGADRVTHTVQLFKLGKIDRILISGGIGALQPSEKETPEANKFRDAMVLMGIPDSVITLENQTRNTAESSLVVTKMLRDAGYNATDCLLVTSAFHMRRSIACYRKAGMDVDTFSTDFFGIERHHTFESILLPQVDAVV